MECLLPQSKSYVLLPRNLSRGIKFAMHVKPVQLLGQLVHSFHVNVCIVRRSQTQSHQNTRSAIILCSVTKCLEESRCKEIAPSVYA